MQVVRLLPYLTIKYSKLTLTGSTFIELDDVRVPVGNLIGEENKGFALIMSSKFSRDDLQLDC